MMISSFLIVILVTCGNLFQRVDASRRLRRRQDFAPLPQSGYVVPLLGSMTCIDKTTCSSMLPPPPPDRSLRYLALARGLSLYTCADHGVDTKPTLVSIDTTLWDAVPLLPQVPNEEVFHTLIKQLYEFDYTALKNSSLSCIGAASSNGNQSVYELFDVATFTARTEEMINAPEDVLDNLQWAHEISTDLSWDIFRVETFGGAAPSNCEGQNKTIAVDYAAEYWFYR